MRFNLDDLSSFEHQSDQDPCTLRENFTRRTCASD